jgi:hypothetical protein
VIDGDPVNTDRLARHDGAQAPKHGVLDGRRVARDVVVAVPRELAPHDGTKAGRMASS